MGLDAARIAADRALFGGLLESSVAMEITKQIGWSRVTPAPYHFRTHQGDEVDLVLYTGGEVVPFGPRLFTAPVEALWRWGVRTAAASARAGRGVRGTSSARKRS
jgi:Domain of unknown function (DUF4143)